MCQPEVYLPMAAPKATEAGKAELEKFKMGMWRNWYTLASQKRISQEVRVQISPCPPGRSIPVVRILREDVDRVQFSTARQNLFFIV